MPGIRSRSGRIFRPRSSSSVATIDLGAASNPWATLDGSANAPTGTSPTGLSLSSIAFGTTTWANALSGYLVRPPWKVSGVDYRVGINQGVTLKAPSTLPTSGSPRVSGTTAVIIDAPNSTLDGYDLSGYDLQVTNATNFLVQNCKFSINASGFGYYHGLGNCSGTVRYCELYGNYATDHNGDGGLFFHNAIGSLTVQYCYLERAYADFFDIYGGAGSTDPVIIKYNVIHSSAAGGHPDWIACGGSAAYGTCTSDFNLWLNIPLNTDIAGVWGAANTQPAAGTQGVGWDGFNTASNVGPISVSNNTIIALPGASMNLLVGEMLQPTSGAYSYTIANNYLDPRGSSAGIQHGGNPETITGNINMNTGASAN